MRGIRRLLGWLAFLTALGVGGVALVNASDDCAARGGALVRGAVGFVCVAAAQSPTMPEPRWTR